LAGFGLYRLNWQCTNDIRKDSPNRSRSTLIGRISGRIALLLPEFPFASADARFIGNPVDFVVFDGFTRVKDGKGEISIVLVEVKKGKGKLTWEEKLIKKAVEQGRESRGQFFRRMRKRKRVPCKEDRLFTGVTMKKRISGFLWRNCQQVIGFRGFLLLH
jgi:hypothetical protein